MPCSHAFPPALSYVIFESVRESLGLEPNHR
jgi:hypothetical protein